VAVNEIGVDCSPSEVFALFADGWRYADWVVGAKRIRSVDPSWPAVGSRLHHTVGLGPLEVKDNTEVLEVEAPHRLLLLARFRPIGRARIKFELQPDDNGSCLVRMTEELLRAPEWVHTIVNPTIHARNAEALRRLRVLLEG